MDLKNITYTSVENIKDKIVVKGYYKDSGKRYKESIQWQPYLFVQNHNNPVNQKDYKTIYGEKVYRIDFDNIWEARNYIRMYKDVVNYRLYGMNNFIYPFIHDSFAHEIEYDIQKVKIGSLDIETNPLDENDTGFPNVELATHEITVISIIVRHKGQREVHLFSQRDFDPTESLKSHPNISKFEHHQFDNETKMLKAFVKFFRELDLDVMTHWNGKTFDIPYIVNRCVKIFGMEFTANLSPFNKIEEYTGFIMNKEFKSYKIFGIASLDYLDLYKKFVGVDKPQPTYRLDWIGYVELGMRKLDYSQFGSLSELYKNNPQLYQEYNIRDSMIVNNLEDKIQLLDQILTTAYICKVNYEDVLSPVRYWDTLIYNDLADNDVVVPFKELKESEHITGGYVKEPIPGLYKNVVSFDFSALYPNSIIMCNISPETYVDYYTVTVEQFINHTVSQDILDDIKVKKLILSPSGHAYRKDIQGIIPRLMEELATDRNFHKDESKKYEKEIERIENEIKRREQTSE